MEQEEQTSSNEKLLSKIWPFFKKKLGQFSALCNNHHVLAQLIATVLIGGILTIYLDRQQYNREVRFNRLQNELQQNIADSQEDLQNKLYKQQEKLQRDLFRQQEEDQRALTTTQTLDAFFDGVGGLFQKESFSETDDRIIVARTQILLNNLYKPEDRAKVIRFVSTLKPELFERSEDDVYITLQNIDLRKTNLSDLNLQRANLDEAYLVGCNLTNTNLSYASIRAALLDSAYFEATRLDSTQFNHTSMKFAEFKNLQFDKTILSYAKMMEADFDSVTFRHVKADSVDFANSGLNRCTITKGDFSKSNWNNALIGHSTLDSMFLKSSNWDSIDVRETYLMSFKTEKSSMRAAEFYDTDFEQSQFSQTQLNNAIFKWCRMNQSHFDTSDLGQTSFYRSKFDATTFKSSSLVNSDWSSCTFEASSLEASELYFMKMSSPSIVSLSLKDAIPYYELKSYRSSQDKLGRVWRFVALSLEDLNFVDDAGWIEWFNGEIISEGESVLGKLDSLKKQHHSYADLPPVFQIRNSFFDEDLIFSREMKSASNSSNRSRSYRDYLRSQTGIRSEEIANLYFLNDYMSLTNTRCRMEFIGNTDYDPFPGEDQDQRRFFERDGSESITIRDADLIVKYDSLWFINCKPTSNQELGFMRAKSLFDTYEKKVLNDSLVNSRIEEIKLSFWPHHRRGDEFKSSDYKITFYRDTEAQE